RPTVSASSSCRRGRTPWNVMPRMCSGRWGRKSMRTAATLVSQPISAPTSGIMIQAAQATGSPPAAIVSPVLPAGAAAANPATAAQVDPVGKYAAQGGGDVAGGAQVGVVDQDAPGGQGHQGTDQHVVVLFVGEVPAIAVDEVETAVAVDEHVHQIQARLVGFHEVAQQVQELTVFPLDEDVLHGPVQRRFQVVQVIAHAE